ncbi:mannose-1-phosphate guanylyltransferase/mannose-6-phosphate isomerase [Deltaproteobacteria bacterium TL4]
MIGMILAGGSGSRLWPYSRTMSPKQFLNLGSTHESLLQDTYKRLTKVVQPQDVYIVGAKAHEYELIHQMDEISSDFKKEHLLLEPMGRNTAPAILWGLLQIPEDQRNEAVVILPADHLIAAEKQFIKALLEAEALTHEGWLVTFGIRPDRPETGYGYIKAGTPLSVGYRVEKFVEKPDLATAKEYIQSDAYTWNAGIFMATATMLLGEYRAYAEALYDTFHEVQSTEQNLLEIKNISKVYAKIPSDSIDYAILEKSQKVAILPVDMEWSDLGSWEGIHQVSEKDENGNVTRGNVISRDTKNCLIFTTKKLVTSIGVEDLIIVETDDALLVCDMKRSQDVKNLVETLKQEDRYEYKFHTTVMRPWGSYTVLHETPHFKIVIMELLPGRRMSLQRHRHRNEHWVVAHGTADVICGKESLLLSENESIRVPQTVIHRLGNSGKIPLNVIEIQHGAYLGLDDIERFADDFGQETIEVSP